MNMTTEQFVGSMTITQANWFLQTICKTSRVALKSSCAPLKLSQDCQGESWKVLMLFEHHSLSPTIARNLEGPSKPVPGRPALNYILQNVPLMTQFPDIYARVPLGETVLERSQVGNAGHPISTHLGYLEPEDSGFISPEFIIALILCLPQNCFREAMHRLQRELKKF